MTVEKYESDFGFTKDTSYRALTGKLWGVYGQNFGIGPYWALS